MKTKPMTRSTVARLALVGFLGLLAAACAPASAREARGDLHLTAGSAAQASSAANRESQAMGGLASDIMIDVRNIKEVEAWFDQGRLVSFD